ncbi:MAG: DUF2589 domain-containing protein [Gammaproteobacteria bacterium]|nr:DUF2589 domain-containing protein [Gammaproteobacteria bacterium]
MARQISEFQSIPFHQIIGSPLLAMVQGQAQAAQATAEFIERIGFKQVKAKDGAEGDNLGELRMVTFSYQKPDDAGNPQTYEIEIPLLSLIPIPGIQIKEGELEFNIKVNDIQSSNISTALNSPNAEEGDWLSPSRVEFRAAMGQMKTSTSGKQSSELQMKVKMKVEQAEIPAGLSQLFRLMDQSINSSVQNSAVKETPNNAEPTG